MKAHLWVIAKQLLGLAEIGKGNRDITRLHAHMVME
jgi:hypothetical protein